MVLIDGNVLTQDQRRYAQGKWSQVNGVPKEAEREYVIRIATLNIRSGQAEGMETALHALRQGNIGIGVLQETKITRGIHMQQSLGYTVWVTEEESQHRGDIAIV